MFLRRKKYKFNPDTLNFEYQKEIFVKKLIKGISFFILSTIVFVGYFFIYTSVLGYELPKTSLLKKRSAVWYSKLDVISAQLAENQNTLYELQLRDNNLYRPIFGMDEISQDVRNAGFGGVDRYDYLKGLDRSGVLTSLCQETDILIKKAYIQSSSYEDVDVLATKAEEMAYCIPRISPVSPRNTHLSSGYGMRLDPITKDSYKMHSGLDISGPIGTPVYVTGDGVITKIYYDMFGYGHYIVVDHGFGYKTRYAHLNKVLVKEGQKVKRGDEIALLGNSGRSTGSHVHYEVIFRGKAINPLNYFNYKIKPSEYAAIIHNRKNNEDSVNS